MQAKGQSTGKVDYRLKGSVDTLKNQMKQLEKLSYLYKEGKGLAADKGISQKEKDKRVVSIDELKSKADKTV